MNTSFNWWSGMTWDCLHNLRLFTWFEIVYMIWDCLHDLRLFTWFEIVYMIWDCLHDLRLFTWFEIVYMIWDCLHDLRLQTSCQPMQYDMTQENLTHVLACHGFPGYSTPSVSSIRAVTPVVRKRQGLPCISSGHGMSWFPAGLWHGYWSWPNQCTSSGLGFPDPCHARTRPGVWCEKEWLDDVLQVLWYEQSR